MPRIANTPSSASAAARARVQDSIVVPTVSTVPTPAERARSSSAAGGSVHASRCACVSTTTLSSCGGVVAAREQRRRGFDAVARRSRLFPDAVERRLGSLAQWLENSRRRLRDVRLEQDRDRRQSVDEVVEDGVVLVAPRLVLRDLPRCLLLDVLVEAAHRLPDLVERARDVEAVEAPAAPPREPLAVERRLRVRRADRAVAIARDHRRCPREEVAEVIAELALVALVH